MWLRWLRWLGGTVVESREYGVPPYHGFGCPSSVFESLSFAAG